MRHVVKLLVPVVVLCLACGGESKDEPVVKTKKSEPDRITAQHILIAFKGTMPARKKITRSKQEAEELALQVFEMAKSGGDFDELVKEYTDESYPGKYRLANYGVFVPRDRGIWSRERVVEAFGDVAFKLEVGEIGLANYDPEKAKFGWHIIKRIR